MVVASSPARRVACVDVPALALQLVLQAHPEWRADPVVVVEHERPEARIVWANRAARAARIERGQRFRTAEALALRLHAAVVAPVELEAAVATLLQLLHGFSPAVEPVAGAPGHFFVDASGLHELFTGLEAWACALHAALAARGFVASVVVGFARFAAAAVARTRTGWLLLRDAEHERQLAAAVPFDALDAPLALRARMRALGVRTLGEFLALPAGGLARRFGADAKALHARATAPWAPLTPVVERSPLRFVHEFELADADLERFVAALAAGLEPALASLAERRESLAALRLELRLERAPRRCERLAPAAPTRDAQQLLELVRLRFAGAPLAGPIEGFAAELESVAVPREQLALLAAVRRRDVAAADRALARLAAAFGDAAVTRARLVPAHLPERSFAWEPIRSVQPRAKSPSPPPSAAAAAAAARAPTPFSAAGAEARSRAPFRVESDEPGRRVPSAAAPSAAAPSAAEPGAVAPRADAPPLVRTLWHEPQPLGTLPVHEPEAWLGELGAVQRSHGPFRLSGTWWAERVERDYFFLETDRGAVLWVFHDRRARRWYLHGRLD